MTAQPTAADLAQRTRALMAGRGGAPLPVALACFGSVGAFKGFPGLAASPVDLTLLLALVVAGLTVVSRTGRDQHMGRRRIFMLWACFVPGAAIAVVLDLPLSKSLYLFTVTLVAAVAGATLRRRQVAVWVVAQVVLSAAMAVLVAVFPDSAVERDFGRSVLLGGTSISAARVVGVGIVVAVVMLSRSTRMRDALVLIPLAAGLSVSLLSIGSRGPFVAVLAACTVGLLFGRVTARRKFVGVGLALALGAIAVTLLGDGNARALNRLLSVFTSPSDPGREWLADTAGHAIANIPLGLGWGGFSQLVAQKSTLEVSLSHPHNLVLELLVEDGWMFGLLALLWISALVVSAARAWVEGMLGLVFPLLTYWLVNAMFSSDINGNRELWITLGVAAALLVTSRRGARGELRKLGAFGRGEDTVPAGPQS